MTWGGIALWQHTIGMARAALHCGGMWQHCIVAAWGGIGLGQQTIGKRWGGIPLGWHALLELPNLALPNCCNYTGGKTPR